jgi:glycosyltransferase involved in cell wall biosynthesis
MKLLVISCSSQRGGLEEYVLAIASAALERGWDVHAACPKAEGTASLIQDFTTKEISYHSLEIDLPKSRRFRLFSEHLPEFAKVLLILLKIRPTVVLLNLPWIDRCLGSLAACGLLKMPTVVVFHLVADQFPFTPAKLRFYKWLRSRKQQWITVSEHSRKSICDLFQASPQDVLCIYNGIKAVDQSSDDDSEQLRYQTRQEIGVSDDRLVVLTVGRLCAQKGYSDIVPIVSPIVNEFPNVRFVWAGEGEQRNELVDKIRSYGVEENVLFLGYCSDVSKLLKSADLFLFPTYNEGLPFALLEAMVYGLPVVASDASSIPEIVENKVHGVLFPTGDRAKLLEALRWALRNPEQMQQFARSAQSRIQLFSEDNMTTQTLKVLYQLSGVHADA